jgi:hypothetical protein
MPINWSSVNTPPANATSPSWRCLLRWRQKWTRLGRNCRRCGPECSTASPASIAGRCGRLNHRAIRSDISLLMRAMCSPLLRHQQAGARGIHKLLTQHNPPIDDVVAWGAMRPLAELLEDDSVPLTQMDVVRALAKISCTPKHTAALVKVPGAVASFVRLLLSANEEVCLQAARMLGNCAALLPGALRNDALSNLVQVLERSKATETPNLRRNVVWTISECCRAQPPPPLSLARCRDTPPG